MRRHHDWSTPGFDLPPVADAVGPFPRRLFLRAASELLADDAVILEDDDALAVVVETDGLLTLAGDADLTDYHTPLGGGAMRLFEALASDLGRRATISFDSLPIEAAEVVAEGLGRGGLVVDLEPHTVTAVLELPDTFDAYLDMIGKKQRHEVRRKRRRYEEGVGALIHERHTGLGWAFDEFVRLHRLAPGEKGSFMTSDHERFFRLLAEEPGWRVDVLRIPDTERAAACLFSWADTDAYYLYNSSYDPGLSDASPGVAIIGSMIEQAIAEGIRRFDFLKGDEVYKFRLGAEERPLHRVRVMP